MTETDQKRMLTAMTGEKVDDVLSTYLLLSGEKILSRAFPFRKGDEAVPEAYKGLQVEIAAYLLNKRGAEGETAHSEAGISRSYENADVPLSMLSSITPHCEVMG